MSNFGHGGVPTEDELIAALAKAFDAPEAAAITWLARIKTQFDPKAAAERLAQREYDQLEAAIGPCGK